MTCANSKNRSLFRFGWWTISLQLCFSSDAKLLEDHRYGFMVPWQNFGPDLLL